jgi:hypothetical protein
MEDQRRLVSNADLSFDKARGTLFSAKPSGTLFSGREIISVALLM